MSHERKGMSTTAKVLLITGGAVGTLLLALVVVGFFAVRNLLENAPELLEELGEVAQAAAGVGLGNVSTDFTGVVSDAGTLMLFAEGAAVEPASEGSGFTLVVQPGDGEPAGIDLAGVVEYLDRVGRGEAHFGDVAGDDVESAAPEWVSVFPGARLSASALAEFDAFSFGIEVLLADAGGAEVLEWYEANARDTGGLVNWQSSISQDEAEPRRGSIAVGSTSGMMIVLIAEDDRGDSFFVILYTE